MISSNVFHGVGRRKSSVARVWLKAGSGEIVVNGKGFNDYFCIADQRMAVKLPFELTETANQYSVQVNVVGGGITGQTDATKLAIARALEKIDANHRPVLKAAKLLSVDSRIVERKKPGQPKARRKFQFVKR